MTETSDLAARAEQKLREHIETFNRREDAPGTVLSAALGYVDTITADAASLRTQLTEVTARAERAEQRNESLHETLNKRDAWAESLADVLWPPGAVHVPTSYSDITREVLRLAGREGKPDTLTDADPSPELNPSAVREAAYAMAYVLALPDGPYAAMELARSTSSMAARSLEQRSLTTTKQEPAADVDLPPGRKLEPAGLVGFDVWNCRGRWIANGKTPELAAARAWELFAPWMTREEWRALESGRVAPFVRESAKTEGPNG
jgi:hypothetical protein